MVAKWVGIDGIEVEVIVRNHRALIRLCQWFGRNRYHLADCATVAALERHGVDLADLVEVVAFPQRSPDTALGDGAHST